MSEENSAEELKEMNDALMRAEQLAARKKIVDEKSLVLREHKVSYDYSQLEQTQKEMAGAKNVNFSSLTDAAIQKLIDDNDAYMRSAKNAMTFICKSLKGIVPYFRKNLIVVAGDTGDGKSTSVANIVSETIGQKNPETGRSCKTLILTNEEAPEDFYNRITCHINGWQYTNHDKFTDAQIKTFNEWIPKLSKGGRLTVIGDTYQGIPGWTTTIEGMEALFDQLIASEEKYDVILIDYYQNVNRSKLNPKLNLYECQSAFASLLDRMKMVYPGAIIVMAQIKKLAGEDDKTPYNIRLKGAKILCDKATFICELVPERELLRSKWMVWKSRFTDYVGQSFLTGYDRGRFVDYSDAFKLKVADIINRRQEEKLAQEMPEGVIKKKGKKDGPQN